MSMVLFLKQPPCCHVVRQVKQLNVKQLFRGGRGLISPPPKGLSGVPAGLLQLIICSLIHHSSQMQIVYPHWGKWS